LDLTDDVYRFLGALITIKKQLILLEADRAGDSGIGAQFLRHSTLIPNDSPSNSNVKEAASKTSTFSAAELAFVNSRKADYIRRARCVYQRNSASVDNPSVL
jgi:hypothetical protein